MPHGYAVIDGDRIEFFGYTAGRFYFARDQLTQIFEMDVPGHKLGERVRNRDDRFIKITVFHPRGTPQGTSASHIAAMGGGAGTILRHKNLR